MSSSTDPAQPGATPSDPAELRREIEQTRRELAETVEQLAAKADVKGRAQDKAQELKSQATQKAHQVRSELVAKAPELTAAAGQQMRQQALHAQRVVQDKPRVVLGAALAVLALLIFRRWRETEARET